MLVTKKMDAYRIYMIFEFFTSFGLQLIWLVAMVHLALLGFDPLQLILVGTALEVGAFFFEIPTGVVADVFSRRLSVIIGVFTLGFSYSALSLTTTFEIVLITQFVAGIGYTFLSGATSAWLADEIGEEKASKAYLRAAQIANIASMVGIFAVIILGARSMAFSMLVGGIVLIGLGVFLSLYMPENGFSPTPKEERETFREMKQTFVGGIRAIRMRPVLLILVIVTFLFGAYSEGFDRLWQLHVVANFNLPQQAGFDLVIWFALISLVSSFLFLGVTKVLQKRIDMVNGVKIARFLALINIGMIIGIVVFAFAENFILAMLAFWALGVLRGLMHPLKLAWMNQGLDTNVRATVLSMISQTDAIGQIGAGPTVGLIGQRFGVRIALACGAIILLPITILYARTIGHQVNIIPSIETAS
ncbi:MAG: MFS transporter [Anaerolineae bacterium]|nr:MFS transporter [Anaerolineae bacterium]